MHKSHPTSLTVEEGNDSTSIVTTFFQKAFAQQEPFLVGQRRNLESNTPRPQVQPEKRLTLWWAHLPAKHEGNGQRPDLRLPCAVWEPVQSILAKLHNQEASLLQRRVYRASDLHGPSQHVSSGLQWHRPRPSAAALLWWCGPLASHGHKKSKHYFR